MDIVELLDSLPPFKDEEILKSFVKGYSIINDRGYKSILCSISGGSDSDVMLDIIHRIDVDKKVKYVWFDTGLEYKATKDHLEYLEKKYNITIEREKAVKPIPRTCKEYGQPFLNKHVSEMIYRLQKHGFKWEDKPLDELIKEYPKCKSALLWWTNSKEIKANGHSMFNINYNKGLKEFMIANPPTFKISAKCCQYAKKDVSKKLNKKYSADLAIIGVRRAEGGIRATRYTSCYSNDSSEVDSYRPLYWFLDDTKKAYEGAFNIVHSDCYTKYGFKRTGCCCCPFGRGIEEELAVTQLCEPNLYKAVCNVFKESYEYTRKYRAFVSMLKLEDDKDQIDGQMNISDFLV